MMRFLARDIFHFNSVSNHALRCGLQRCLSSNSSPSTPQVTALCDKICVLGAGKMAEALLSAIRAKGIQRMSDISVYDVNRTRLDHVHSEFGCRISSTIQEAVNDANIIILSVKPQNVEDVAKEILSPPSGIVLSIVAGYTIENLQSAFKTKQIVRSMPNTPATVLEGITVWTATKEVPEESVIQVRTLLGSVGEQIEVSDERYLDMATAVSGSGPAYVFLTMEAMIDAAVHLGFPRETAVKLVTATIKGSAVYAQKSFEDIPNLRSNVTSPGGTTASALYELERGRFRTVVADAIWAAYRRALEIGGNNPNVGPGRNKF